MAPGPGRGQSQGSSRSPPALGSDGAFMGQPAGLGPGVHPVQAGLAGLPQSPGPRWSPSGWSWKLGGHGGLPGPGLGWPEGGGASQQGGREFWVACDSTITPHHSATGHRRWAPAGAVGKAPPSSGTGTRERRRWVSWPGPRLGSAGVGARGWGLGAAAAVRLKRAAWEPGAERGGSPGAPQPGPPAGGGLSPPRRPWQDGVVGRMWTLQSAGSKLGMAPPRRRAPSNPRSVPSQLSNLGRPETPPCPLSLGIVSIW